MRYRLTSPANPLKIRCSVLSLIFSLSCLPFAVQVSSDNCTKLIWCISMPGRQQDKQGNLLENIDSGTSRVQIHGSQSGRFSSWHRRYRTPHSDSPLIKPATFWHQTMATAAKFQFVEVNGQELKKPRSKAVRSHAARNCNARAVRVTKYQQEREWRETAAQQTQDGLLHQSPANASLTRVPSRSRPLPPRSRPQQGPVTLLSAAKADPFHSFSRRMGSIDNYLLNHCTLPGGLAAHPLTP